MTSACPQLAYDAACTSSFGTAASISPGVAAVFAWAIQDAAYTDEQFLAPHERRLVIGLGAGACAAVLLTAAFAVWMARVRRARHALYPDLHRLRMERKMLLPAFVPAPSAHGMGALLVGHF